MIVPAIGTGTEDDPIRADMPDGFVGRAEMTANGDYLLTPDPAARMAALEARLDAVAALAEKADATAREVAAAARPPR
jgi:hypothetical protein